MNLSTTTGAGSLHFTRVGEQTRITHLSARAPLKIHTPENHGNGAWAITTNLGGGLVDGDHLSLRVALKPAALAMVGTQASTKVYRSQNGTSQTQEIFIEENAALCWLSDPIVCFRDANYRQHTKIVLGNNASVLWVEALTAGRTALGERWDFSSFENLLTVEQNERLLFREAQELRSRRTSIADRMGMYNAQALLLCYGPMFVPTLREQLQTVPIQTQKNAEIYRSGGLLPNGTLVLRYLGMNWEIMAQTIRRDVTSSLHILGDDPLGRRW